MKRTQLLVLTLSTVASLLVAACSSNPATGGKNVVMGSWEGEKKTTQKHHQEIVKALVLYDDQATQEYVNIVGNRVARVSDLPNEEFKFFVIDDEAINAFTTGCCTKSTIVYAPESSPSFLSVFSAKGIELWRKPVVTVQTITRFASAAKVENAGVVKRAATRSERRAFFMKGWGGGLAIIREAGKD